MARKKVAGARGLATVGQRRARQSHGAPARAPRRAAPPPAFQRASLRIYSAATRDRAAAAAAAGSRHRVRYPLTLPFIARLC